MKSCKILTNFVKIFVSRNLYNAVLQPLYVGVEEEKGGRSGEWARRVPPCSPSTLMQIVPISAYIYTVFHSVIFNSVRTRQRWTFFPCYLDDSNTARACIQLYLRQNFNMTWVSLSNGMPEFQCEIFFVYQAFILKINA